VSLSICSDLAAAGWIVASDVSWERLVTFGPAGFPAYARVRFIPDPSYPGQAETQANLGASPGEVEQWRALLQLLATETSDPSDCYFGLWDGWGFPEAEQRWPTFGVPPGARFPARAFFLFHGALADAEIWGPPAAAGIWGRPEFSRGGTPAFVWPSDHTWCVAADVDPHWAGIGATAATIQRLLADHRLDAVTADPGSAQPTYA
jgi:hypothetical protein